MSNHNYMDDVPVKIAESYKPLPKVFQVPQAIANKLQLSAQHYHESPNFSYDFQLEKKVLAQIPDWRRMRQHERELRLERKQRREEQRMRDLEQKHKNMLGAVSYPDAEELSSESDTEEEEPDQLKHGTGASPLDVAGTTSEISQTRSEVINSFDNILQPTILPQVHNASHHTRNKSSSSFNYKDFEEDTSSPFDNIELKTINDLDILAQVLQHAQLKSKEEGDESALKSIENSTEQQSEEIGNIENKTIILEKVSSAFEHNDSNDVHKQISNIPPIYSNNYDNVTHHNTQASTNHINAYSANQQQAAYMHYNQQQPQQQPQQQQFHTNFNHLQQQQQQMYHSNHNYLYSAAACNGGSYYSPSHAVVQPTPNHFVGHNANTYLAAPFVSPYGSPQVLNSRTNEEEAKSKSKSVPDIIKELTDEVRNSELRRSRNYSYNMQQEEEQNAKHSTVGAETEPVKSPYHRPPKIPNRRQHSPCFNMLEVTTQKLAKNISSMGFPLERVAKVAQLFGADDKKIIEHLIPLSELIDLGFEESKISEALMRFDNNKEKALEYLIS